MVDPSGHYQGYCGPGQDHTDSGPYGGNHQPPGAHLRQLLQELGREPTTEEIDARAGPAVERVSEIMKMSQEPVSLETPIGEEEDSHLGDFIQDDNVLGPRTRQPLPFFMNS